MSLNDSKLHAASLGPGDTEWLHLLMGDWQIIADTAHADIVLWLPDEKNLPDSEHLSAMRTPAFPRHFTSAGQVRPSTVHTVFYRDMVDQEMGEKLLEVVQQVWRHQKTEYLDDTETSDELILRTGVIPLVRHGRTIAVLTIHTELFGLRRPPRIETVYKTVAEDLIQMVKRGAWPEFSASVGTSRGNPRVSDGLLTLDSEGIVNFASPNVSSIYKRLGFSGELEGKKLVEITRNLMSQDETADETLPLVLSGRMPWRGEIKVRNTSVTFRAIPLRQETSLGEERYGAILLCRDVSELRRRELELMTKDATIREIHHRVKNNLQTVSALLRLQSRRMKTGEAKQGLEQAMRRVATIAMVHEALSQGLTQNVDFDELIQRQFHLAAELASPGQHIRTELNGTFGELPSQFATPLALVINEIVANAVEHGLDGETGTVTLTALQSLTAQNERQLTVTICDDGCGMVKYPIEEAGTSAYRENKGREGLGMQIVRTLVASELNGSIRWEPRQPRGTAVTIRAHLTTN